MTTHRSILSIIILVFAFSLPAQQPTIKTFTAQDGLVTNQVRKIYQDSKGFIWIGTLEGISQFNGHQFINYSIATGLPNSVVNDFIEIDGKMLVALGDGYICAIQNGEISSIAKTPSVLTEFSSFLKLPDGRLMISTTGSGIYEYKNGRVVKPKQELADLHADFITSFNDSLLVCSVDAGKVTLLTNEYRPIADTILSNVINSVYKDSHQRVWLCSNKGLSLLGLNNNNKITLTNSLPKEFRHLPVTNTNIFDIEETAEDEFWIATTTHGIIHLTPDGNFTLYTDKDGLAYKSVFTIFCDREKNIWTGTIEGLSRIVTQNNIHTYQTIRDSPTNLGTIIPWKKNEFLLMTYEGPVMYDNNSNHFSDFKFNSPQRPLYIFPGTKPLLYTTGYTFGYFDSVQNKTIYLKSDSIICVDPHPCIDSKGITFLNLSGGIAIISGEKVWINKEIKGGTTSLTMDKKGFLWAGCWNSGLYRIQYSFSKDSVLFSIKDFSHLVPDKFIRSLFTDQEGNIWVGTRYKGAFRLTQKNNDEYTVIEFDQKKGLASDFIKCFAETSTGDIWIGSLLGLDKLIKEKKGFRVFNFSRINNLYGVFFSIINSGNDEWLCNVTNKLVKFTDHKLENTAPLTAEINIARFGSTKDSINVRKTDTLISLKYFQNYANFEFGATGFINDKQILYSHRLSGSNDTTWSEPRNIHEVYYASLQPGHYTFEVRTIGWNNQPGESTRFSFIVKPPFWQTWWFMAVCVLLIATLLYTLYRYRIRQVLKLQRVRNRIATDLHDDIGSTLTNISILTELSKRNRQEPEKAEAYLDRISEEIDSSGQALDDIIWSVNTKNDTVHETAARMRRYAAELFDARNIRYELKMDPQIADKKIMMEQRRDLFLIFKETLNNIQKHSAASVVSISLFIEKENINLIINDNGKGFDATKQTHRNGIKNLEERVNRWKGGLIVESGNGDGTTINVRLPLSGITQNRE